MQTGAEKSTLHSDRSSRVKGPSPLDRVGDRISELAGADSYGMLTLAAALVIGPLMLPVAWSGNEIVYFDLAYRNVRPDAFSDAHAMFDASQDRIVAMMTIGYAITLLGFEAAKTVLALVAWGVYSLGLGAVARALGMRFAQLAAALTVFVVSPQNLVSGEWMFGTIEPKTLAYLCVTFGVALACAQRWLAVVLLLVLATYFHFLIGGTWVLLLLLLMCLDRPKWTYVARLLGLYTVLVLPIALIILRGRFGETVDTSALPGTPDQVYALFRVSQLVAPFANGLSGFGAKWLPGLATHAALSVVFLFAASGRDARSRTLAIWASILNLLPLLATLAAFLDRDSHVLAKFFLFRPSSPILLLSCLLLARLYIPAVARDRTMLAASVLCLSLAVLVPGYLNAAARVMALPPGSRLVAQLTADQRDIAQWIIAHTEPKSAILTPPVRMRGSNYKDPLMLGLERLTGRGFIVAFKNVPSDPADFVRWYSRLDAAEKFFRGDCAQLGILRADYVIVPAEGGLDRILSCIEPLYRNGTYVIARVR